MNIRPDHIYLAALWAITAFSIGFAFWLRHGVHVWEMLG